MKWILVSNIEFREIYCRNCKKVLGKYNKKFFNDDKIGEILKIDHVFHVRSGHEVAIRKVSK